MAITFHQNYELLELEKGADWKTANRNYRRLVHAWHPDRFNQRPRERAHAQSQFIELTKAFNNLRAYYRQHHRLPFQHLGQSAEYSPEPPSHQRVSPDDQNAFDSGILNKRKPSAIESKKSWLKPLLWSSVMGVTLFGAVFAFFVADRKAKMIRIEEAKSVLKDAEPSEFMKDEEATKQANNRAVLLNRTNLGGKYRR